MFYTVAFLMMLSCSGSGEKTHAAAQGSSSDSLKVLAKKRTGADTRKINDSIMFYEIKLHQLMDSATQLYDLRKQKLIDKEDVSTIDKQLTGVKNGNRIYRARLDSFTNVSREVFLSQPEEILQAKPKK